MRRFLKIVVAILGFAVLLGFVGEVSAASFTWGENDEIYNDTPVVIDYVVERLSCTKVLAAASPSPNGNVQCSFTGGGTTKIVNFKNVTGRDVDDAMAIQVYDMVMDTLRSTGLYELDSGGGREQGDDPGEAGPSECASILVWIDPECDGAGGEGVWRILSLIVNIMTAGVGVLATIGLIISGMQWMTARDNEAQVVKAKSRIFNIVIGLVIWALMWLVLTWLIPGFTLGGGTS